MRVAVVGAGAVGLCCAFSLARGGADVVVLERDRVGEGCSWGNTGWVLPALTAPLPAPGVMWSALRGMLRRDSPVLIRPIFGPEFLRWSWDFWRACSQARYRAGFEATVALARRTFELFDDLAAAGVEFEMHESGLLVAWLSDAGKEEYVAMVSGAAEAGYPGEWEELAGDAVRRLEPAAGEAVTGGIHAPSERYVRPETLTRGLADALRAGGAEVREGAEVRGLERVDGRWRLQTADAAVEADGVLVAAGAWSGRLLAPLGVRLPLEAAKGYSVTARGPGTPPRHAYYLAEAKLGISTFAGDVVRIAGVFDLTGLDLTLRRRRIETIVRTSEAYLRDWRPEEVELEWAGLRPYPPDGLPVVGPVPGREGLYVATGHGRLGITLAPPTAEAVRELVLEGKAAPELAPFGIERFARRHRRAA